MTPDAVEGMPSQRETWVDCAKELPPDGVVVETRSPGRMVQALKRSGRLWFLPDGSMYVYYTPTVWRPLDA